MKTKSWEEQTAEAIEIKSCSNMTFLSTWRLHIYDKKSTINTNNKSEAVL